jgi:hypothetical protein
MLQFAGSNLYIDRRQLKPRGATLEEVASALADWLPTQPGVERAYATHQFAHSPAGVAPPPTELAELPAQARANSITSRVRKSFFSGRSGDVVVVEKPYYLFMDYQTGTNHGTPHSYDTHVPLVIYGAGIPAQVRTDPVTPQAAAVILARSLEIHKPLLAEAPLPKDLFR